MALINPGCLTASEKDARKFVPADIFLLSPFPLDELRLSKIAPDNRVEVASISSPTSKERWNHSLSAFSFKWRRLPEKRPRTRESSFLFLSSSTCKASISESRGDLVRSSVWTGLRFSTSPPQTVPGRRYNPENPFGSSNRAVRRGK